MGKPSVCVTPLHVLRLLFSLFGDSDAPPGFVLALHRTQPFLCWELAQPRVGNGSRRQLSSLKFSLQQFSVAFKQTITILYLVSYLTHRSESSCHQLLYLCWKWKHHLLFNFNLVKEKCSFSPLECLYFYWFLTTLYRFPEFNLLLLFSYNLTNLFNLTF